MVTYSCPDYNPSTATFTAMSPFLKEFLARPYDGVLPSISDEAWNAQLDRMREGNSAEARMHRKMDESARRGRLYGI